MPHNGRIDRSLLKEIDSKRDAVRDDPSYYLKRSHRIVHALNHSAKVYSWYIEHPDVRRDLIGKRSDSQVKGVLITRMRQGVDRLMEAWDYVRVEENYLELNTLMKTAHIVDPYNMAYRTNRASLQMINYVPPNSARIYHHLESLFVECSDPNLSPVEKAALIHLGIAGIQPFDHGNKRVSRLYQDKVLFDADLPPAVIPFGERSVYLDLLEQALLGRQEGSSSQQRPFFDYIGGKVNASFDNILGDLRYNPRVNPH